MHEAHLPNGLIGCTSLGHRSPRSPFQTATSAQYLKECCGPKERRDATSEAKRGLRHRGASHQSGKSAPIDAPLAVTGMADRQYVDSAPIQLGRTMQPSKDAIHKRKVMQSSVALGHPDVWPREIACSGRSAPSRGELLARPRRHPERSSNEPIKSLLSSICQR
jgi:hypothetical protein